MDLSDAAAATAAQLVAEGKGILAADESSPTIKKRFDSIDVESTEENRRDYRQLLFTTEGVEKFISGVILFDETIRQKTDDGTPLPELLDRRGIIPGIKVDQGKIDLTNFPGEKITEGLDRLGERLEEYRVLGARFTKWRAVITIIGETIPSRTCIEANAAALARFAALSQKSGLTPIVEPEVLMDGKHTIERCEEVTLATLDAVFSRLREHRVSLEGILLKPNMVLPGKECPQQSGPEGVAAATIRTFRAVVPAAAGGIVFLSGGQSPEEATANLNALNRTGPQPWELSFSFGRALQQPVLAAWKGKAENVPSAQQAFHRRARLNSLARRGEYTEDLETGP